MRTGLTGVLAGRQPQPQENMSIYFYWPRLETPAGVRVLSLLSFMVDLWRSKEPVPCISVADLCLLIAFKEAVMHFLKFEFYYS